jgi:hypothetical protein
LASGDHKPEPLDIPSLGRREHSLTLNGAYRIEQISTELDLRFSIARKLAFTEVWTYLLDQIKAGSLINDRQLQFREPLGEAVDAGDPLINFMRPIHQRTAAINNLPGKNFGGLFGWRCLNLRALE